MEFEDEHDEEQEEDDEEEITIPPPLTAVIPPSFDSNSSPQHRPRVRPAGVDSAGRRTGVPRYRECLKNHAVSIGGHAVDGCGEFMAAGEEGTLDALRCAACNCHRNFHRKEIDLGGGDPTTAPALPPQPPSYPQFTPYYRAPPPPPPPSGYLHVSPGAHHHQHSRPLAAIPSTSGGTHSGEMDDMSNPSSSGGGSGMMMMVPKKRFRTKFTQEQKDKMLAFAEKLGWRIQKHDEAAVQQFCAEIQVKRQVLKVWMHNNKHSLGKKP